MADATHERSESAPAYSYRFRVAHWILLISLGVLIPTGLSLHAAARPDWSIFSGTVPSWLLRGRITLWHYWTAVAFLPALLSCLPVMLQRDSWRRPTRVILIGGGFLLALSGLWMLFPWGANFAYKTAVAIHTAVGLLVLPIALLLHATTGLTKYLRHLVPSFRVWRQFQWSGVVALVVVGVASTWVMFEGWPLKVSWRNLVATRIPAQAGESSDDVQLELAELPWDQATPLSVMLVGGSGFSSGQTEMTLRALHDGEDLFIKAQWDDPTEDYDYWPWQKRADGWEYLQSSAKDETVHYEDKFSMVFPIKPSWHFEQAGCAIYCHVDGQFGWGYKGGQPDIDVWHWKAARTGSAGQIDDKYWSVVDFSSKEIGRNGDPKDGGGYVKNISEDGSQPLFLPDDWENVFQGAIPKAHAVEFTPERAKNIPVGTKLPGVVSDAFQGDRGNVSCHSVYANDQWTMFIRRKLDTGSKHDVRFVPGGTHLFGCAAFDHAAKRHARSMPVLRLVLEE